MLPRNELNLNQDGEALVPAQPEQPEQPEQQHHLLIPLLGGAGNKDEVLEFENVDAIFQSMMTEEWFRDLYNIADGDMDQPYDYHSCRANFGTALAIACSLSASILYVLGGSKDGAEYVVGGVAVNLFQTFFFTKETISFFSKIHGKETLAAVSFIFAAFATSVVAFATYQMSDNNPLVAFIEASMVFAGNLPQNLYGMFASIKSVLDSHRDDPKPREFLINALRNIVDGETLLLDQIPEQRGVINRTANQVVGFGIGIFLSLSQVGYMRSSVDFIAQKSGSVNAGVVIGILTNLPALMISMFISSRKLASSLINSAFDFSGYLLKRYRGQHVPEMTRRESYFLGAKVAAAAAFGFAARYSASTSIHLYNDNPPVPYIPSAEPIDDVIKVAISEGCEIFNGVMAIMAADSGLDHLNKAYVVAPSKDEIKLRIKEIIKVILENDIEKIRPIAVKAGYKDVAAAPAHVSFFRPAIMDGQAANDHHPNGYAPISQDGGDVPQISQDAPLAYGHR